MIPNKESYISTTVLPIKTFLHEGLLAAVRSHKIPPFHVKIKPTNKCPSDCETCTFKNRDKAVEIPYSLLIERTETLIRLGMKAVTLTGGGDPLAYPEISQYIKYLKLRGILIGLVTNGILLKKLTPITLSSLSWCRVSIEPNRAFAVLRDAMESSPTTDWSVSYLLNRDTYLSDLERLGRWLKLQPNISHLRIVDDVLSPMDMKKIKDEVKMAGIKSNKFLFQSTAQPTQGHHKCLSSLLKPSLNPYGELVPCCGVPYATDPPLLNWSKEFSMGGDIEAIYQEQRYFCGSKCTRCFQGEHNDFLNTLWNLNDLKHRDFI